MSSKKKWSITATVVGGKFVGNVEADTEAEAIKKGWKIAHVSLCRVCARECEDISIDEIHAEPADGSEEVK